MCADVVRIQLISEQRQGSDLFRRTVREQGPIERSQELRHFEDHVLFLHLLEDGHHHVFLTVDSVAVSGRQLSVPGFAYPHIIETGLSVHELEPSFVVPASIVEIAFQVVPDAAYDIYDLFDRLHGHREIIIHVDAA